MSLFDTIYRQIGESSVQKLKEKLAPGAGATQLGATVNKAIGSITDSLSAVAQTEEGRLRLYESIRYADDSVLDYPDQRFAGKTIVEAFSAGNDQLSSLVGSDTRDQIARSLLQDGINAQQADSVVGYLTPAVLGSLKREIDRGHVLDNACLLYTSPSPRDGLLSRMPSSA